MKIIYNIIPITIIFIMLAGVMYITNKHTNYLVNNCTSDIQNKTIICNK